MRTVYLDNNATTPLHPEVKEAMIRAMELYGNASSMHSPGQDAYRAIEDARAKLATFIGSSPDEIIFTGSGSEANNTVLNSVYCEKITCSEGKCGSGDCCKNHLITSVIEHPSILQTAKCYERRGFEVTYVPVDRYGIIDPEAVRKAIKHNTGLISIMYANNEIGTIQPIKEIAAIAKENNIYFHTDGVQALGKIRFNVRDLGVDFMSFSGHKIYAPKGVGVLYSRKNTRLCPLIYGGHHERNRRAGTENTIGIIALGKAIEIANREMDDNNRRYLKMKQKLRDGLTARIPHIRFNGHPEKALPNTLNVTFEYVEGESILLYADFEGISFSTGSACSTGSLDPSHVILALGVDAEIAHGSIRFSFGMNNTDEDVDYVLEKLPPVIERLRVMSPLYKS